MTDIRHAIQEASETTIRLLNYKKSGKPFWNMFTLAPMADADGTARFLIGVQVDVTAIEEALPEGLKATTAGPQVPTPTVCLLDKAHETPYCTNRASEQTHNTSRLERTLPANHLVLLQSK